MPQLSSPLRTHDTDYAVSAAVYNTKGLNSLCIPSANGLAVCHPMRHWQSALCKKGCQTRLSGDWSHSPRPQTFNVWWGCTSLYVLRGSDDYFNIFLQNSHFMINNATPFTSMARSATRCWSLQGAGCLGIREQHWSFSFLFKWCFVLFWNFVFGVFIMYVLEFRVWCLYYVCFGISCLVSLLYMFRFLGCDWSGHSLYSLSFWRIYRCITHSLCRAVLWILSSDHFKSYFFVSSVHR